jgi:hypothetical protein
MFHPPGGTSRFAMRRLRAVACGPGRRSTSVMFGHACEMLAVMYLQRGPPIAENEATTHRTDRTLRAVPFWCPRFTRPQSGSYVLTTCGSRSRSRKGALRAMRLESFFILGDPHSRYVPAKKYAIQPSSYNKASVATCMIFVNNLLLRLVK